jgi:ribonucleoside-diphosphate reductase beta chain
MSTRKATNWNIHEDEFTQVFWEQNTSQFWLPEEIPVGDDESSWKALTPTQQEVFKKVLAGLTLLDTEQGLVGMPAIGQHTEGHQRKTLISFMGTMEGIHAKSYSNIFTTLLEVFDINDVFNWQEEDKYLQYKAKKIVEQYENIHTKEELYIAYCSSVFLESLLFYSGFYYPLYLSGQGKMSKSGEMISLIIRDEAIHGVYIGLLAQELLATFSEEIQEKLVTKIYLLLNDLMQNEYLYTESLYSEIGLDYEVKQFVKYNANKALMNLGLDPIYEHDEINPIVLNGLNSETVNHDFFSMKGNGYQKAVVEYLTDEDFNFEIEGDN